MSVEIDLSIILGKLFTIKDYGECLFDVKQRVSKLKNNKLLKKRLIEETIEIFPFDIDMWGGLVKVYDEEGGLSGKETVYSILKWGSEFNNKNLSYWRFYLNWLRKLGSESRLVLSVCVSTLKSLNLQIIPVDLLNTIYNTLKNETDQGDITNLINQLLEALKQSLIETKKEANDLLRFIHETCCNKIGKPFKIEEVDEFVSVCNKTDNTKQLLKEINKLLCLKDSSYELVFKYIKESELDQKEKVKINNYFYQLIIEKEPDKKKNWIDYTVFCFDNSINITNFVLNYNKCLNKVDGGIYSIIIGYVPNLLTENSLDQFAELNYKSIIEDEYTYYTSPDRVIFILTVFNLTNKPISSYSELIKRIIEMSINSYELKDIYTILNLYFNKLITLDTGFLNEIKPILAYLRKNRNDQLTTLTFLKLIQYHNNKKDKDETIINNLKNHPELLSTVNNVESFKRILQIELCSIPLLNYLDNYFLEQSLN